jgi:hypothetical protein
MHAGITAHSQQIARPFRRHDRGLAAFESAQARQIEMIHVSVTQQDEINFRHVGYIECGCNEPLYSERGQSEVNSGTHAEHRIRKNREAIDLQQYGAVSDPRRVEAAVRPAMRARRIRRG